MIGVNVVMANYLPSKIAFNIEDLPAPVAKGYSRGMKIVSKYYVPPQMAIIVVGAPWPRRL
jgi:hypothetical protein